MIGTRRRAAEQGWTAFRICCERFGNATRRDVRRLGETPTTTGGYETPGRLAVELNKHILDTTRKLQEDLREDPGTDAQLEGPSFKLIHPEQKCKPLLEQSLDRLHVLLKSKRHRMDHVNVATILHQLGSMTTESHMQQIILRHPLFKELCLMVLEKLNAFEAMHVANIVWAFSNLGPETLHLKFGKQTGFHVVEALLMHAVRIVASFVPQSIAQLANGLARLDFVGAREFMPLLAVVAKPALNGFSLRELSVFLHALAKLNYEDHVGLFKPVVARLESAAETVTATQQVSNITWALYKLEVDPKGLQPLLEKLQNWTIGHMEDFEPTEMATYVGALLRLRFLPTEQFLEQLDTFCQQRSFQPNEVSELLVAYAKLGRVPGALLDRLESIPDYAQDRDVALVTVWILWSLAILEKIRPDHLRWAAPYLHRCTAENYSEKAAFQLAQAFISLKDTHPSCDLGELLPAGLAERCLRLWRKSQREVKTPSRMRSLFYLMQRLGYHCEVGILETGNLSAFTATHPIGHRIAVEVDPPSRKFLNAPKKLLHSHLWRTRLLTAGGWRVLRIDVEHFPKDSVPNQILYLKREIELLYPPQGGNLDVRTEGRVS